MLRTARLSIARQKFKYYWIGLWCPVFNLTDGSVRRCCHLAIGPVLGRLSWDVRPNTR
ncbi:hypothetical protein KAR91_61945 [Candidatus Pacearchaeota archaeon]|nr:hypothetical protein [Candidatus Pacearchaeota archaeon]